ncbi:MarR family transcriptional regulator [Streptomyces sp. NBC_00876]|uniref:MarR family transcriptional regulator n=1 Tax=Streptomyces sp. NBC_00876 TaxID=2975853 RepID=UPI0038699549|nr:MarR family transcriptional regulator [Streptomyces sp. NBC_00876]
MSATTNQTANQATNRASNPTPTLNPQLIGEAENAHKPLMAHVLRGTGTTFVQWVALKTVAAGGGAVHRDQVVGRLTGSLKTDGATARATVTGLTDARLLRTAPDDEAKVAFTESGAALYHRLSTSVAEITADVYSGIPAEDMATAARVLARITARANAVVTAA